MRSLPRVEPRGTPAHRAHTVEAHVLDCRDVVVQTAPLGRVGWAAVMPSPETAPRRLLLSVDAPSLLHRNHHARAETDLRDRGGRPAWALHGMLRQILDAIDQFAPDAVLFGLDDRTSSVREQMYPDYKAGRAPKDATLISQLERAGALLDAL